MLAGGESGERENGIREGIGLLFPMTNESRLNNQLNS